MNDRPVALDAGTELEMPGPAQGNDRKIVAAVQSGVLDESVLDESVARILRIIFKAEKTLSEEYTYDVQAHHALARQVAGEGAVLLKNEQNVLPLSAGKIALLGGFAKAPRYQRAGSSLIVPTQLDNLYDEMAALIGAERLAYAPGYSVKGDVADDALIEEAVALAQTAETAVICAGLTDLYETEGLDRTHMQLPAGHNALIEAVAAVHDNVVVVLSNGSPVEMPWVDKVSAILEGYLGGQAGAGAIADLLVGKINPSGKIAETFPIKLEDNPSYHYFPGGPATVEYRESIYVGYRYYDTVDQDVLFPFGHGLSYTTFEYSNLHLDQTELSENETLTVSCSIKNNGTVAGKEIVQLYVRDVESTVFRPEKELKGFVKVNLEPGESQRVSFKLDRRAFAFYSVEQHDWLVESGEFEILVGASSRDVRLQAVVAVSAERPFLTADDSERHPTYHNFPKGTAVNQEAFETLLGQPVPPNQAARKGNYTLTTPLEDMTDSFIARQVHGGIKKRISQMVEGQEDTPTAMLFEGMGRELPLRSLITFSNGTLNPEAIAGLLQMMNGQFFRGIVATIKGLRKK